MRKLKLQMQISIDGFVSTGPNDEQKWVTWAWEEIKPQVLELIDTTDTIVIGRKLASSYIPYWEDEVKKADSQMYELAKRIYNSQKIIFSKSLNKVEWKNTKVERGDLSDEIVKLKKQNGKDIIVYGGSSFVSALIKEGLIDEFHLFVNPVALGHGRAIFDQLKDIQQLKLKKSVVYNSGIVLLNYAPK